MGRKGRGETGRKEKKIFQRGTEILFNPTKENKKRKKKQKRKRKKENKKNPPGCILYFDGGGT